MDASAVLACAEHRVADEAVAALARRDQANGFHAGAGGERRARPRSAALPSGHQGQPTADVGGLRDLLLRVSRLADDLPEVTELGLNPVIARPDGAFIVDARINVTPYRAQDPFLRKLR